MPAAPLLYSKQYQDETASLWRNEPLLGAAEQDSDALVRRTLSLVRNLPTTGESDVCVTTIATDLYNSSSESGAALLQNKIDFCEACGYRCLIHTRGEHATHRPHKWDKILALHDAMRTCNIVLYVDADVVFRRAFQLPPLTRSWLAGSKDFVGINSGVLLVVRSKVARKFLPAAWSHSFFNRSFSAEQNAMRLVLRRPFVDKHERTDRVTVFENLVAYQLYRSHFGERVEKDTNFTAPMYHAAGCTASIKGPFIDRIRRCQDLLLHQIPQGGIRSSCPSLEARFKVSSYAFNRHTQRGGATNLGRRWLTGHDLRIRYTDQKGTNKTGQWWLDHLGCAMYGCGDAGTRKAPGPKQRDADDRDSE